MRAIPGQLCAGRPENSEIERKRGMIATNEELTSERAMDDIEVPPTVGERELRKRVFGLAWPVIGENFLETLLGIVDTLLVAGLGAVAIAGVGSALQVMFFMIAALSALSIGSAVLVAQAVGAGDARRASGLARQSLLWSAIFSIPLAQIGRAHV